MDFTFSAIDLARHHIFLCLIDGLKFGQIAVVNISLKPVFRLLRLVVTFELLKLVNFVLFVSIWVDHDEVSLLANLFNLVS